MNSTFDMFRAAAKPKIVEHLDLPARQPRFRAAPSFFRKGESGAWLDNMLGSGRLWHHQSLALEKITAGANVVISTSTASGKSLVFQAAAMRCHFAFGGRSIVLYPQKALSGDQLQRWRRCFEVAGLSPDLVGEINGDVGMAEREAVLKRCIVILATEDVLHAYLMRQVAAPSTQQLLRSLTCLVIDEAHALEGVFGSSSAFFLRRLRSAALAARAGSTSSEMPLQIVAATATIADPVQHLSLLTGTDFESVGEEDNGAPFHGMDLLHIEGPDHGAPAEKMLAEILSNLSGTIAPNAAIAFVDGRQAAERITNRIGHDEVQPYRSGYKRDERKDIEDRMRAGTLRAVVATSALELGIDIPGFTVGLALGVPQSRKALRQRIGRAGRAQRSVFAVIAPSTAFIKLGGTFRDYVQGPVEPSPLYLDNRIIQFQQACCLLDEVTAVDGRAILPDNVPWPSGFAATFEAAQPGAPRSREFDQVAVRAHGSPHTSFSLRHIGDVQFRLRCVNSGIDIGTIDLEKALREAFPGATYRHNKAPYKVVDWRQNSYERLILLRRSTGRGETRPMHKVVVGASQAPDAIIEHRLRISDAGSIAEMEMRIVESVEGYTIGSTPRPYRELRETDRAMCRKQREFTTTGILIRVSEPWFAGNGESQRAARRKVCEALLEMLARDRCISKSELRVAHCNIIMHGAGAGPTKIDDGIAIFDDVQGGLRLTARLFDDIRSYLERFSDAAETLGDDGMLSQTLIDQLRTWESTLERRRPDAQRPVEVDSDERIIFAPDSEVALLVRGQLHHRRLIEPQLMWVGDEERLGYRYEAAPGVAAWIPHERVESVGSEWRHVVWNARSGMLREIEA